jgi:hypothetical protein
MGRFFQQSSWLGIDFSELSVWLDPLNLAGKEFYDAFYTKVLQTYPNYSDFPSEWRAQKQKDAEFLSQLIPKHSKFLSYGCGVGYLESCLMEFLGGTFYVSDFSPYILSYRPDLDQKYLGVEEIKNSSFSCILLNQVSYALNNKELIELIDKIHTYLTIGGKLVVTFSEVDFHFLIFMRDILSTFIRSNLYRPTLGASRQGWGYRRSKEEMFDIIANTDFEVVGFSRFESQSYLMLKKI